MIGSLGVAIFAGWKWGAKRIVGEITSGFESFKYGNVYAFFIRFVAPAALGTLLVYLLFNPNAFA
jgi:SNF family Na+-dependent transporter